MVSPCPGFWQKDEKKREIGMIRLLRKGAKIGKKTLDKGKAGPIIEGACKGKARAAV